MTCQTEKAKESDGTDLSVPTDARSGFDYKQVLSGILVGAVSAMTALSLGAILFGAIGEVQLGIAVTFAGALVGVLNGWLCRNPLIVSQAQSVVAVILALGVANLDAAFAADTPQSVKLSTATLMVVLSTFLTGVGFFVIGALGYGRLSRAIPYPVLGGFLAATGFQLIERAIRLGHRSDWTSVWRADFGDTIVWLLPMIFAVALVLFAKRVGSLAALVGGTLSVALAFAFAGALGVLDASDGRHYLSSAVAFVDKPLPPVLAVGEADFSKWLILLTTAVSVAVVSLLAVLMNLVAVEQSNSKTIGIDKQIKAAGVANLIGGSLGGVVAYPSYTIDSLSRTISKEQGKSSLIAVTLTLGVISLGGIAYLDSVPLVTVIFLLTYLGAGFVYRWLWSERRKMPFQDFLIVLLIMFVTIQCGVLFAIAAGFAAAILRFTLAYSRLSLVRSVTTLSSRRSTIERPESVSRLLGEFGNSARLYELQGYLFFGSISALFDRVLGDFDARPDGMKTPMFDLSRVQGLDVSAVRMIARLDQQASAEGMQVWISGVSASTEALLARAGLSQNTKICRTLDEALIQVETEILSQHLSVEKEDAQIFELLQAAQGLLNDNQLKQIDFSKGETIFEAGDPSNTLVCLMRGEFAAVVETGQTVARFEAGALCGEIGFLTGGKRTATVKALSDGSALVLSKDGLEELKQRDPDVSSQITLTLAQVVARRLERTTKRLVALEQI